MTTVTGVSVSCVTAVTDMTSMTTVTGVSVSCVTHSMSHDSLGMVNLCVCMHSRLDLSVSADLSGHLLVDGLAFLPVYGMAHFTRDRHLDGVAAHLGHWPAGGNTQLLNI